jgi:methylthioribose-1-phosphate isomerase
VRSSKLCDRPRTIAYGIIAPPRLICASKAGLIARPKEWWPYPMNVGGRLYRTIWLADDGSVEVIDQTRLPHEFTTRRLRTAAEAAEAIRTMVVRGAPLIGATAAHGISLALRSDPCDAALDHACSLLAAARPTAVNLRWAIGRVRAAVEGLEPPRRAAAARRVAVGICDDDVAINRAIGERGLPLLAGFHESAGGRRVDILTHCNAGWLATVDWGTALAPVYMAHDAGVPVHVWVTETRPRNQGAGLTAWELREHGVPHTVVVDGAAGHLMQRGRVSCCIVGTDRTTAAGDVCNKIGTYMLALAARESGVPFYVAVPGPSIDWSIEDGHEIPIEERDGVEVSWVSGRRAAGSVERVLVVPAGTAVSNYAFDVTPRRLVTALITERGVCPASKEGLRSLYACAPGAAPAPPGPVA